MADTDLFRTLDELKPFIFRITDNGGKTADRYTVVTCDGDYWSMSSRPFHPQGVGMTGEGLDVLGLAERVEAGVERDIRWIDLPEDCQRCVMGGLNQGFADYVGAALAAAARGYAYNFQGWRDFILGARENAIKGVGPVECIYRDGDAFRIRDDDRYENDGEDPGPFATYREAVLRLLPSDYDLSGPEYHAEIDMWNVEGGPVEPWDRELDPPMMDDAIPQAKVRLVGPGTAVVGYFEDDDDAYAHIKRMEREAAPAKHFSRDDYVVLDVTREAA